MLIVSFGRPGKSNHDGRPVSQLSVITQLITLTSASACLRAARAALMATITFSFSLESLTTRWLLTMMGSPPERTAGEVMARCEKSSKLMSGGNMVRISSSLLALAQSLRVRAEKGTE